MKQRSIGVSILLTILTCGLYGLYWIVCVANDVKDLTGTEKGTSGGMVLLLSIITCNIYWLFWVYKAGQAIDDYRVSMGKSASNKSIVYLLLSFFGLDIIALALLQSDINDLIEAKGA